jgi:hypothetical protein
MSKKSKGIIKAEEHGRQWTKKMKKASSVEDILDAYGLLKVWKNSSFNAQKKLSKDTQKKSFK